jgi:serine/threonine-protein kinase
VFATEQRIAARYRLTRRIAAGGMGEVWRGHDERLQRDVAVKLLDARHADDERFRSRLRAEARSAAGLHSERIVAVYDWGEQVGGDGVVLAYIVMELVDGSTVGGLIAERGAVDAERCAGVLADAATGLAVAHARGLVHRDVKPANLLLGRDGRVKVADFGIARASDAVALTTTGMLVGTAAYISPEQVSGCVATAASDIYSLGVVAYQCLTGELPFHGDGEIATALARLAQPVPSLPADVPGPLADLVLAMMAREPADRPTADEVTRRAGALFGAPTMIAVPATLAQPTRVLPLGAATASLTAVRDEPRVARPWLLGSAAAVVATAGLVTVLLVAGSAGGGATPRPTGSTPAAASTRSSSSSPASAGPGPTASVAGVPVGNNPAAPPTPGGRHGPGANGHGPGRGHQHGPGGPPGHNK